MPADLLEFEEPLSPLLKEIDALSTQPRTRERQQELDGLQRRLDELRADIYTRLTPWQRVMVARHNNRPTVLDYVQRLFTEFTEISGDRRCSVRSHGIRLRVSLFATRLSTQSQWRASCSIAAVRRVVLR